VSGWLPDDAREWQGRPVVRRVAEAAVRHRAVLSGVVRTVVVHGQRPSGGRLGRLHPGGRGSALDALLDDGSGTITLRWHGRRALGGVVAGATLHVEGTLSQESDRFLILNPLYRFAAPNPSREPATAAGPASAGETPVVVVKPARSAPGSHIGSEDAARAGQASQASSTS
jgi:hypothetical protein